MRKLERGCAEGRSVPRVATWLSQVGLRPLKAYIFPRGGVGFLFSDPVPWFLFTRWLCCSRAGGQGFGKSEDEEADSWGTMSPHFVHGTRSITYEQPGQLSRALFEAKLMETISPLGRLCPPLFPYDEISMKMHRSGMSEKCRDIPNIYRTRTRVHMEVTQHNCPKATNQPNK